MNLVLSALGEEEQTLASLAGPSGGGMSNAQLLVLKVLAQLLDFNGIIREPEVTLGETEAAVRRQKAKQLAFGPSRPSHHYHHLHYIHHSRSCYTYLTRPGAL